MRIGCLGCVLLVACSSGSKSAPSPAPETLPPPAASAAESKPAVQLPAKGFDVTHILGHTKLEVDKELGHGEQMEDGPWLYDGFGPVAITVLFDTGKAAYVSVQPPNFERSQSNLTAVQAWEHAPSDADYDHLNKFEAEVIIWAPGMQDRQRQRRELALQLTAALKSSSSFAAANGIDLEVSTPPGKCNQGTLRNAMNAVGGVVELKKLGFAIVECSGEDNTTIKL